MTRRRTIAIYIVANVLAVAAATVVAIVSASPIFGAVLVAAFSMLSARIVFRKWPMARWHWLPWKGVDVNKDDDLDPVHPGLWRLLQIGFVVVTGIVLFTAIRDAVGA